MQAKIANGAIVFLAILLCVQGAQGQNGAAKKTLTDYNDVTAWMRSYYADPDPNNIIPAITIVLNEEPVIKDDHKNGSVAHFFAAAIQADKSKLADINKLVDEPWGDKRKFVQRITDETNNFVSPAADNPDSIDCLWEEFTATGAEAPVKKIMKVLDTNKVNMSLPFWTERGIHSDQTALEVLQEAAQESLIECAAGDKRVCDIINKEITAAKNAYYKAKLQNILSDAAQRKRG